MMPPKDIYGAVAKGHETWLKTDLMDFGAGDGGFTWQQDPAKHREVAKKVLPGFSTRALKAKEPIVYMYMDLFIEKMKEFGDRPGGVDITKVWFEEDAES